MTQIVEKSLENSFTLVQTPTAQSKSNDFNLARTSSSTTAYQPRSPLLPRGTAQLIGLHDPANLVVVRYRDLKAPSRSRLVIGQAMHRPVSSLKARGESTSAGRRPACSLATDCKKSNQIMSPASGQ